MPATPPIRQFLFPIQFDLGEPQPNRRPFVATLFRADVTSLAPPIGSDRPVRITHAALQALDLNKLIGLPIHATPNLDGHWLERAGNRIVLPVGTITAASLQGDVVIGAGVLWDRDHPELVSRIKALSDQGKLAVSWEIEGVVLQDADDHYRILQFTPTGFALLSADVAAYRALMPALAALANKEHYDPTTLPTEVLLDDHRLLHAYYATIRRGKEVTGWTLSQVVRFHAAVVDEMLLRHLRHHRGEGFSRQLNEESLRLQALPVFTDEVWSSLQGVWIVSEKTAKEWQRSVERHERIELTDPPQDQPIGAPIGLAVGDHILAAVAIVRRHGKTYLAFLDVPKRPIPVKAAVAKVSRRQEKLQRASAVLSELPDTIVLPGYVAVTGSSLLTDHAADLDLLILDDGQWTKLRNAFTVSKPIHIVLTKQPSGLSVPVYDLVLVKRVRAPIEPVDEPLSLCPHRTVVLAEEQIVAFIAARMRSLGDLPIYPLAGWFSDKVPVERALLFLSREGCRAELSEGAIVSMDELATALPASCLSATCEVWWLDGEWHLADCLWWNATRVAELPFPWRLSFVGKLADALGLPIVPWQVIAEASKTPSASIFVFTDGQSSYAAGRWVVRRQRSDLGVQNPASV
jgi:hypothetical protein